MTEVPAHLLERARAAKEKAAKEKTTRADEWAQRYAEGQVARVAAATPNPGLERLIAEEALIERSSQETDPFAAFLADTMAALIDLIAAEDPVMAADLRDLAANPDPVRFQEVADKYDFDLPPGLLDDLNVDPVPEVDPEFERLLAEEALIERTGSVAPRSCERCWHEDHGLSSTADHTCPFPPHQPHCCCTDCLKEAASTEVDTQQDIRAKALELSLLGQPNSRGHVLTGSRYNQTIDLAERFAKWIEKGER